MTALNFMGRLAPGNFLKPCETHAKYFRHHTSIHHSEDKRVKKEVTCKTQVGIRARVRAGKDLP